MRPIDADALRERVLYRKKPRNHMDDEAGAYDRGYNSGIAAAAKEIADAPTLSADEVRGVGEWIDMADFEQCSVCKGTRLKEFQSKYGKTIWIRTPYCPNCGARMKGAGNNDSV